MPEDRHWPGLVPPHSPEYPEGYSVREHGELPVPAGLSLPTVAIPRRAPQDGTTPIPGYSGWTQTPVDTDPAADSPRAVVYPGTGTGAAYRRVTFHTRTAGRLDVFPPGIPPSADTTPSAVFHVGPGSLTLTISARASLAFTSFPTGAPAPERVLVLTAAEETDSPDTTEGVVLESHTVPGPGAVGFEVPPQGCLSAFVATTMDATVTIDTDGGTFGSYTVLAADPPLDVGPLPARARISITPTGAGGNALVSFRCRW